MFKYGIIVAALATLADQLHKSWMIHVLDIPEKFFHNGPIEVTSFFNIVMVWNYGVSFGMLSNDPSGLQPYLLSAFALVVVGVLLFWLKKMDDRYHAVAIGLVMGGAVGNTIDRFAYGAVADFFDFHISGYHWPAFNIADSVIFIGVFMLVMEGVFNVKKES